MTTVFGEVADEYDDVRPGYPDEVSQAIGAYAGPVDYAVEVGAGTGKGTAVLAALGVAVTCVEPDPRMTAVLRARFPQATVVESTFEKWAPPAGGVPLLACALAWHWLDPHTRNERAHASLRAHGTLAVFTHRYQITGQAHFEAIDAVVRDVGTPHDDPPETWFHDEIAACGWWKDVAMHRFSRHIDYPTGRYQRLFNTFSTLRRLAPPRQVQLLDGIGRAVDGLGGSITLDVRTTLVLARPR